MELEAKILQEIELYKPKGNLDHTAKLFLFTTQVSHPYVALHSMHVALLTAHVCKGMLWDAKAGFFGGVLHDYGKMMLPATLFDGHDFKDPAEYELVKTHAMAALRALRRIHLMVSLFGSLHHAMYDLGYGAGPEDIPANWQHRTRKKLYEISSVISVVDFIDAFTTRTTTIKDGSGVPGADLKTLLYKKYPDDHLIVNTALGSLQVLFPEQAQKIILP
jgi:hypothetical protein